MVSYAWDHAVISDRVFFDIKKACNFSAEPVTEECNIALGKYFEVYEIIDMYSLYAPTCEDDATSSTTSFVARQLPLIRGNVAPKTFSKFVSIHSLKFHTGLQSIIGMGCNLGWIGNLACLVLFNMAQPKSDCIWNLRVFIRRNFLLTPPKWLMVIASVA